LVTKVKFHKKNIGIGRANSILVKVKEIGLLTEALDPVLSHRSGETEDATIAHIPLMRASAGRTAARSWPVSKSARYYSPPLFTTFQRLIWLSHRGNYMRMSIITQLSAAQLYRAAEVQTKIEALQAQLATVLGGTASPDKAAKAGRGQAPRVAPVKAPAKKWKLSAAGRAKIIAASKAYWAKVRAGAKPGKGKAAAGNVPARKKGTISAAGRARLVASAKARWAKVKAAGKKRL